METYLARLPIFTGDPPPQLPTFGTSLGAIMICTTIGCIIFGQTFHQTARYLRLYPTDKPGMKLLVFVLFILDVLHTGTMMHVCYYYLVWKFFDPFAATEGVWSLRLEMLETTVIMLVAHSFYAARLYRLSNGNLAPVISIVAVLLAELGFSTAATVELFKQNTFVHFFKFNWLLWCSLISALLVDILATTFLTYYLRKNRTTFKKSKSTIDVLILYGINTGLSTSIITLGALICALAAPHTLIFYGVNSISGKMYVTSLLAVVNSRRSISDKESADVFETGSFGLDVFNPRNNTRAGDRLQSPPFTPCTLENSVVDIRLTSDGYLDGHDKQ